MALTQDTAGQMSALTVLCPIIPAREPALRAYLDGLAAQRSPLARLPATHFGRFVIVPDFFPDPSQRRVEHLPTPYLLFTATVDGSIDAYLDSLCELLAPEARQIWGACAGAPEPASGPALKAYLLHNRVPTGLFFSAYPDATVETVRRSLECRRRTAAFALRTQGMEPAELQRAFLAEFDA
ncbi:MAG: hypothetical protein ACXVFN_11265 [Solirubrobacteraceae bacterium]